MRWFDGHLDLAYLAAMGRDTRAPASSQLVPDPPACVTLPSLQEGGVRDCLGTIFVEAGGEDAPVSYEPGDARGALAAGLRQLETYQGWAREGLVELWGKGREGTEARRHGGTKGGEDGERKATEAADALGVGILIEGADPIVEPGDVGWWKSFGVVAVGMAWWTPSRYAGGNRTDMGLTDLGRELVVAMDEVGLVHDLSHLSQRATDELLALTDARVMASHSNCRALMGDEDERHVSDEVIREIGRRGGIVGLNLYSRFLDDACEAGGRAGIDACVRHIERVCELVGSRACVGVGSDMDGGFGADRLPEGVDGPGGLDVLAGALAARGWSESEVAGFASGNWGGFWGEGT